MTAANQMNEAENAVPQPEVPVDPFAVDFFGGANPVSDRGGQVSEKETENNKRFNLQKNAGWAKNLPRFTNAEAVFSNLLFNLPDKLSENATKLIAETLANFTFRTADTVKCGLLSVRENNLSESLNRLTETPQIFLTIGCEPGNSTAIAAVNTDFARALIDLMLGGRGLEIGNWRELSPIETTIVEFVALNVLGEINNFIGEPALFLQSAGVAPNVKFESIERGAEMVFNLDLENSRGFIGLVAPLNFLKSLDRSQNPLLVKKTARKLSDLEKIVPALDLRLQIGATFIDADSLLFLEPDDIVLIDRPRIGLGAKGFAGNLEVCVGGGRSFCIRGSAEPECSGGNLNFKIREILSEETRRKFTPAKFKMDELENDLAEEKRLETVGRSEENGGDEPLGEQQQLLPTLENVQVALRVEIAGNKITLRELQNLRAGQIIGLGCRPTDPVRLVTDTNDEPVATGELVEIEGQLGVRLTKVFI